MFLNKNGEEKKTVFLFPGNGIHQTGMLGRLCTVSEDIKSVLEDFAAVTDKYTDTALMDETVEEPAINQLRTVASEIAICKFWERCGLSADIYIGHSLGEYAAAYCAGILSAEAVVKMLTARNGILSISQDKLKMCALSCSEDEFKQIQSEKGTNAEIAAYNSKNKITIVGIHADIDVICAELRAKKIEFFPIQVNGGSHSLIYKPYKEQFMSDSGDIEFGVPCTEKEIISTVIPDAGAKDMCTKDYWFAHIISPVHFSDAVCTAVDENAGMFVDLGVSPNTLGIAINNVKKPGIKWIPTVRVGQNYRKQIHDSFETISSIGVPVIDRFSK